MLEPQENRLYSTISIKLYYAYICPKTGDVKEKFVATHSDVKYGPGDEAIEHNNQLPKSPVVIISLGSRKKLTFSRKWFETNEEVPGAKMDLFQNEGISMFHIQHEDEVPRERHGDAEIGKLSHWVHEATFDTSKIQGTKEQRNKMKLQLISISFCLRMATKEIDIDPDTNKLLPRDITQNNKTSEEMDKFKREDMSSDSYQQSTNLVDDVVYKRFNASHKAHSNDVLHPCPHGTGLVNLYADLKYIPHYNDPTQFFIHRNLMWCHSQQLYLQQQYQYSQLIM